MADEMEDMEAPEYSKDDLVRLGAKWVEKLKAAEKREEDWIKSAEEAEAIYLCDAEAAQGTSVTIPRFNILHSNVETIIPAIYNSTPNPDVRPRHNRKIQMPEGQQDPVKWFSDALERAIATQIDDDKLTNEIEALAQDVEVAGRGVTRIRFNFDDGQDGQPINERVEFENVSWRNYREGAATRWSGVPFTAYAYEISTEEMERLCDDDIMEQYEEEVTSPEEEELDYKLWEIWCRETRKVYFLIEEKNKIIAIKDDPLGLDGFFPQPAPVQPITGTGRRTPRCPYAVYKELAAELDTASKRINKIMEGLKVRGVVAGNAEIFERLSEAGDNQLVADSNLEGMLATGKLADRISWWPVETAIAVLAKLHEQRELTKQAIYEITGISDIVRGASDPRETAAAQKVKAQWGGQRVRRKQRMIQSHVRDLFVLTAEVISKLFTPRGFLMAAGVDPDPMGMQMLGRLDNFRVDVESDSTIRADLDRQRQEMSDFLTATGGFFQVAGPLIAETPQAAPFLIEIYNSFSKSFQLGKQAEDALEQLGEQAAKLSQQPKPNPEAERMKAEAAMAQQEFQLKAAELRLRMGESQQKARTEQQRAVVDMQRAQAELLLKRAELQLKSEELGIKRDDQRIEELNSEIDALFKAEELDIERDQRRPAAIGD